MISQQEKDMTSANDDASRVRNVVLVHGAFVDGSGWEGVYHALTAKGYNVTVVQNRSVSLADDAEQVVRALASLEGPVVLVGHSYGGAVITEAGQGLNVKALVYIAGWVPDRGESVLSLVGELPPGGPPSPVLPPNDGFIFIDPARFANSFAPDIEPGRATFMANSQVPWGVDAAAGSVTSPAWRSKPSWYLVAGDDLMIPPAAQRSMAERAGAAISVAAGSHAIFISKPEQTAALIEMAAEGATASR
jgi:pimeloyl-ACP methyl ester carboxylesterase